MARPHSPTRARSFFLHNLETIPQMILILGLSLAWGRISEHRKQTFEIHPQSQYSLLPSTIHNTRHLGTQKYSAYHQSFNVDFNTNRPSLHLDNYPQITAITCQDKDMDVFFDTDSFANNAFEIWSKVKDLVVMAGTARQCNGETVSTFSTDGMQIIGNKIRIHTTESLDRGDLVTDWKFQMIQQSQEVALNNQKESSQQGTRLQKRDINSNLARPVSRLPPKTGFFDYSHNTTDAYLFNSNYNETSDIPILHKYQIFDFVEGTANCYDCYTKGYAYVHIEYSGTGLLVKSYKMSVHGEVFATYDINFLTHAFDDQDAPEMINITPTEAWDVVGLVSFMPKFRVRVGVQIEGRGDIGLTFGMDVRIPFNISIQSNPDIQAKPNHQVNTYAPTMHAHKLKDYLFGGKIIVGLHFEPDISFQFTPFFKTVKRDIITREILHLKQPRLRDNSGLFEPMNMETLKELKGGDDGVLDKEDKNGLGMKLAFDNAFETVLYFANNTGCPIQRLQAVLQHDHALKFKVYFFGAVSKRWVLWRFRSILGCWFCDKCGVAISGQN